MKPSRPPVASKSPLGEIAKDVIVFEARNGVTISRFFRKSQILSSPTVSAEKVPPPHDIKTVSSTAKASDSTWCSCPLRVANGRQSSVAHKRISLSRIPAASTFPFWLNARLEKPSGLQIRDFSLRVCVSQMRISFSQPPRSPTARSHESLAAASHLPSAENAILGDASPGSRPRTDSSLFVTKLTNLTVRSEALNARRPLPKSTAKRTPALGICTAVCWVRSQQYASSQPSEETRKCPSLVTWIPVTMPR